MNPIIQERIKKQNELWANGAQSFAGNARIVTSEDSIKEESHPVSPMEIQAMLMTHYGLTQTTQTAQTAQTAQTKQEQFIFEDLDGFCSWYLQVKERFSTSQNEALNSLVVARDAIYQGCNCRRDKRKELANEYYKTFFLQNQYTDLILKIKETIPASQIVFKKFGETFLEV